MRRPAKSARQWQHHEWQIQTYAWLRTQQTGNQVVGGIILYLNELEPSSEDMMDLQQEIRQHSTDVLPAPGSADEQKIQNWNRYQSVPSLSLVRQARSIRVIPLTSSSIQQGLTQFDNTVSPIEQAVYQEMQGGLINNVWAPNPDARTCPACDLPYCCSKATSVGAGGIPIAP